jgi:hypothetical protein
MQGRASPTFVETSEILRYTALFDDMLTLENLSRQQLVALNKLLLLPTYDSHLPICLSVVCRASPTQAAPLRRSPHSPAMTNLSLNAHFAALAQMRC